MDFINFIIVDFNRPLVKVKLICDETKFVRGNFRYTIHNDFISRVESSAVFEFSNHILFLHGDDVDSEKEAKRIQSCDVRSFLNFNTARVITNKYMKQVNI